MAGTLALETSDLICHYDDRCHYIKNASHSTIRYKLYKRGNITRARNSKILLT